MLSLKNQNEIKKHLIARAAVEFDFDQTRKTMVSVSLKILNFSESLMVQSLIRHCMSIASRVFSKDKKIRALANGYLDYLDKEVLIEKGWKREVFEHTTTVAMDLISRHDSSILTDLIPGELRIECDLLLAKSDPVTPDQFDQWCANSMQTFEIVEGLPNVATSLASSVAFLRSRLGAGCTQAGKALRYMIENKDVMPDDLGLFGLADDIYVVENAALKLGGFKVGENLLFEFEGYSSSIKGILMEEGEKLIPLSLPSRLLMSSMNYLLEINHKRIVFALPEAGPAGFLALLYFFFESSNQASGEFVFPTIGSYIYFPVWRGFVQTKYLGEETVAGEKFHKVSFDDAGKSSKYMRVDQFRNCILEPRENARIFYQQEHLQQKTEVEVSALFEGLKTKKADLPFLIFLTQKNRFFHFFDELRPFGEALSSLFHITYHKNTGSVDLHGHGENELNVFADAEVAREFFMNNLDRQPTVICDVAELGKQFLEQVGDLSLNRASSLIFFYGDSEKTALETCRVNEFVFCCHGSAYADFPILPSSLKSNKSVGNFERKLVNSYLRPVIHRLGLESEVVDTFLALSAAVKKSSSLEGETYIVSKIGLVSNATVGSLFPLEEQEVKNYEKHIDELVDWLHMLERDDADELSRFLEQKRDELPYLPNSRNLATAIMNNSVEAVFARSNPELKRLEAYLSEHNLSHILACNLTALGMDAYSGNVLVPVMPMRSQMRFLCQTKISNQLLLNLTALEEKYFNRAVGSATKWQNALERANRQTFQNSTTIKRLPPEAGFDFAQALKEKSDEVDNELLNSIRNKSHKNLGNSPSTVREVAVACVHQIADESKVVFLPSGAKVICLNDTKSEFIEKPVKNILDGEIVLLRAGGKGDPYDEICRLTNPDEFLAAKAWANRWRERLRKYCQSNNYDLETLREKLLEVGLERGITTIKGWLESSSTIAPAYRQESIKAIYGLQYSGYPETEVEQVIEAIDRVYTMRRDAGDQLLEYLRRKGPAENLSEYLDEEEIVIHLPTSEFKMDVVHLAESLGEIEVPISNLWDIQELGRGKDAS